MSTHKITQSLVTLVTIHDDLIKISANKTSIIKEGSREDLHNLLIEERKVMTQLEQAERRRQQVVDAWFLKQDDTHSNQTITHLLDILPESKSKNVLEKVATTLIKSVTKLKEQEQLNHDLIQQSMQFIQLSLEILHPSIESINYSKQKKRKTNDRSMFDSKA